MTFLLRRRLAAVTTAALLMTGATTALAPAAAAAEDAAQYRNGPITVENDEETLYTIRQDGTSAVARLRWATAPAWSPNGRHVAYVNTTTGRINVADKDFINPVELPVSGTDSILTAAPTFWSGNHTVVYVRERHLRTAPADGSQGETTLYPAGTDGCDSQPNGAPNGLLVFIHRSACGEDDPVTTPELWVMDAATGQAHKLLEGAAQPSLSPDGTKIAYNWMGTLYLVNVDGTGATTLPLDPAQDYASPAWSPRGDKLVYTVSGNDEGEGPGLAIITLATGATTTIADNAFYHNPAWQPVRNHS